MNKRQRKKRQKEQKKVLQTEHQTQQQMPQQFQQETKQQMQQQTKQHKKYPDDIQIVDLAEHDITAEGIDEIGQDGATNETVKTGRDVSIKGTDETKELPDALTCAKKEKMPILILGTTSLIADVEKLYHQI